MRKAAMKKAGITDMQIGKEGGKIEFKNGQMEIGKTAEWPSDMPSDVPQFTYGKVKVVTKTEIQNKKDGTLFLKELPTMWLKNIKKS